MVLFFFKTEYLQNKCLTLMIVISEVVGILLFLGLLS